MASPMLDIVQRTVIRLSMVPGVAVQVYAEDRIAEMIWHKFVIVRDELWWDDMMSYATLTQDALGRPVENIVRQLPDPPAGDEIVINAYNDIQHVWLANRPNTLKGLPRRANPASVTRVGSPHYHIPDSYRVIRLLPYTPGGVFTVRYKQYFTRFLPADTVPMDEQLLILGAAYDYLEDDGTNPGQIEKFRNMYNDRLRQLKSAENEAEIPLSPVPYMASSGYQVIT